MADTAHQLGHPGSGPPGSDADADSPVLEPVEPTTTPASADHAWQRCAEAPVAATYVIQTGFRKAMKQLRSSLEASGLIIVSEMDISARIRRSLGMELAPCTIVAVTCPVLLLEALVMDPSQLTIIPMHIVAIEKDHWTRIYVAHPAGFAFDMAGAFTPRLRELSRRIRQCLDHVAARIPAAW
jgi:uncharacterized protein (DUF302 family)